MLLPTQSQSRREFQLLVDRIIHSINWLIVYFMLYLYLQILFENRKKSGSLNDCKKSGSLNDCLVSVDGTDLRIPQHFFSQVQREISAEI